MIAVDTNILVYVHREESPRHQAGPPYPQAFIVLK
jgi:hypothetical protein